MAQLDFRTYLDKVRGCFLGKNIGGTLGAPFECYQGAVDLDFYTHDISKGVLPNDDLDLQLVWLIAAEREGKKLTAATLAEYWLTYIVPDWSEYGIGKRNLRAGLLPSVSGGFENDFRESNGCWIRSEIWACLAPGRPDIAVRYAYEDAVIDHFGEGVYAEMFCAAMQSAAFVESDMEKLIDIALSYIPADCDVAKAVGFIRECAKDPSLDWKAARKKLLQTYTSSFGLRPLPGQQMDPEIPTPRRGWDAPSNVAIILLGHYYGKGDFSRAVCIAAGCCEDADCTAGTLASIYGIIGGTACIDEKWLIPIGDEIKTVSLDKTKHGEPATVTELTERIARLMPTFMQENIRFDGDGNIAVYAKDADDLKCGDPHYWQSFHADRFVLRAETGMFTYKAIFDTARAEEGVPIEIDLEIISKYPQYQHFNWLDLVWHLPPEWEAVGGTESRACLMGHWDNYGTRHLTVIPHNLQNARYDVTLEIREAATPARAYIPFTFLNMR